MTMDPRTDATVARREIETGVREALSSFGIAGDVRLVGDTLELAAGGPPVAIELEALVGQWPLLPLEMRQRKVGEVARRLVAAQRAAHGSGSAVHAGAPRRLPVVPIAAAVLAVATVVVGGRLLWSKLRADPVGPAATLPQETDGQARARRSRVCEAARARLFAGASIGPFDWEGWYAELWLATARADVDLKVHPAIRGLVDGAKLAAAADPELAALDGTVEIVDPTPPERSTRAGGYRGVTVRFGGGYVGAFLDPQKRPRVLALADRTADAASADLGALYGRCAHLPWHDLGAWFRGGDSALAATALVWASGLYAEAKAVDPDALAKLPGTGDLEALRAAAKLDTAALTSLVGAHGGAVSRAAQGGVVVTFPLGGGTRATTASRTVARRLGVGVGQD